MDSIKEEIELDVSLELRHKLHLELDFQLRLKLHSELLSELLSVHEETNIGLRFQIDQMIDYG